MQNASAPRRLRAGVLGGALALAVLAGCADNPIQSPTPELIDGPRPFAAPGTLPPAPEMSKDEQRLLSTTSSGDARVVINFEGMGDRTSITTQYQTLGVVFSSATILEQGGSLNYTGFPPRSGTAVVYDYPTGTITVTFPKGASLVGGYITGNRVINLRCFNKDGTLVGGQSTPGPNYRGSSSGYSPNIYLEVKAPGITRCTFADSGNTFTLDDFVFVPGADLKITRVTTALPDSSFTSRDGENLIRLQAEAGDPSKASLVKWKIEDDPSDKVASGSPRAADGLSTEFTVPKPTQGRERWPAAHPGTLDEKALAYRVRAYYVQGTDTTWSDPVVLRQAEHDVLRQEYIDYAKRSVPQRKDVGAFSTTHFEPEEFNGGDYTIFASTPGLRAGVEAFRAEVKAVVEGAGNSFPGMTITSSFRNPVHHHKHKNFKSQESQHLYGNAADVRIWGYGFTREEMFAEMKILAKKTTVNACYEPESVVKRASADKKTLTHFHLDFRSPCPAGW